jgi:hypothetical protein
MATKATPSANALQQFPHLPDEAGVRLPTVMALFSCSHGTIWRMVKAGTLKATKVTPHLTTFNVGSIRSVLNGGA